MARILVCDDERDIVRALKIYLTAAGYEVLEAYNGKEALDVVGENEVDLIVLDVMMPVMDGILCLRKMREAEIKIPVMFLTRRDVPRTNARCALYY